MTILLPKGSGSYYKFILPHCNDLIWCCPLASKSKSDQGSVGSAVQTSLINGGLTSQFTGLLTSWCEIPQHTFRGLLESMLQQVRAVLVAQREPTQYKAG